MDQADGRYGGRYGRMRAEPSMAGGRRPFGDPGWPATPEPAWQAPAEPAGRGATESAWRGTAEPAWRADSALRTDPAWRTEAGGGRGPALREPMDAFPMGTRGARVGGPTTTAGGTPTYGQEFAADAAQAPRRTRELQFGTRRYGPY